MNEWSRRNLLRTTAGAAVAVPMVALSTSVAGAADRAGLTASPAAAAEVAADITADHPVMFCVHDARRGEVSILHGENEVVVVDRTLVSRILHAAASTSTSSVRSSSSSSALA